MTSCQDVKREAPGFIQPLSLGTSLPVVLRLIHSHVPSLLTLFMKVTVLRLLPGPPVCAGGQGGYGFIRSELGF